MTTQLDPPAPSTPAVPSPAPTEPAPTVPGADAASQRLVDDLLARMSVEEKLAQLVGLWLREEDGSDGDVAPMAAAMGAGQDGSADERFTSFAREGLGQLTRPFGTAPVEPGAGAALLAQRQRWLQANTRLGIPALVHEECLTGLAAWQATTFPAPPAWGASFSPDLVERMAAAVGESMRGLGVHQGLAPVLDVVRDARWGRVEECISEDPYVVGTIGAAYVRGLQSSGVVATLKHFVGYSASRAGRNLAPVHAGPREVADVLLPPFEMAVLDAGAQSVMNSYAEVDGLPAATDADLLTGVLRERWGFTGTVVADYFSVAFLHTLHAVAADLGDAAAQALAAGIDVELPTGSAYLEPLAERVRSGRVPEALVDRAVRRVLRQKAALGLLDPGYDPTPAGPFDLDPPGHRALAAELADRSVVLLSNDGTLPLGAGSAGGAAARVAVLGPNADAQAALFGCYSFVNHVLDQHPQVPARLHAPTVLEALRAELPGATLEHVPGCTVDGDDPSGIAAAVAAAASADVAVVVAGDRAGLFGRGTSGEGCDTDDLRLPGVQQRLVEEVLDTGTPVVLVLLTGRPYAVGPLLGRAAAVVQAFFPGEEGAAAVAGVLSGRVNPSGRLPLSLPRSAGAQPYSYLHPRLGAASPVSNLDTAPPLPFGHGLSYTSFERSLLGVAAARVPTDGSVVVSCRVTNTGTRAGADVVQLYGSAATGSTTRPLVRLLAYARVELDAGESAEVELDVPASRLAASDRALRRTVEPGRVRLLLGPDCSRVDAEAEVELTGAAHAVTTADRRLVRVAVRRPRG